MDTNLIIAKFIAKDENSTEILLPKYGWFSKENKVDLGLRPLSEAKFDTDWNYLILAGQKLIVEFEKMQPETDAHKHLIDSRFTRLITCIGTCDIKIAYDAILEQIEELNS